MARYQVILAYDGTDFAGSQRQASPRALSQAAKSRTVQGELEKALRKLEWTGRSVLLAGRTDSGVHAEGQVAAFDFDWRHTPEELRDALNASLSADMAVRTVRPASANFHPRFDATSRRYRYRLFCQPVREPLRERFAWRVWPVMDGGVLVSLAQLWIGKHDFAAFGSPSRPGSSTLRTVLHAVWQAHEDEWWFDIQADAFLYRMVRRLVYVQVAVAQGKLPAKIVVQALVQPARALPRGVSTEALGEVSARGLPAGLAPAHGLTLMEVTYPPFDEVGKPDSK